MKLIGQHSKRSTYDFTSAKKFPSAAELQATPYTFKDARGHQYYAWKAFVSHNDEMEAFILRLKKGIDAQPPPEAEDLVRLYTHRNQVVATRQVYAVYMRPRSRLGLIYFYPLR